MATMNNKEHVKEMVKWLIDEVLASGGDGDGIWYSKYFNVDEIETLIKENNLLPDFWKMEKKEDGLRIGDNQEWLFITNNKNSFDNRPEWQQVSLVW